MADAETETEDPRTRAEREKKLKDAVTLFNKRVRSLGVLARKIHNACIQPVLDKGSLLKYSDDYASKCDEINQTYDRIHDLSFDAPDEAVVAKFDKFDSDSQTVLRDLGCRMREADVASNLDASKVEEKTALSELCD